MYEVTRYTLVELYEEPLFSRGCEMVESEDGDYVLYESYADLKAKYDELRRDYDDARKEYDNLVYKVS